MWRETFKYLKITLSSMVISKLLILAYRLIIIRGLSVESYANFALLTTTFSWVLVFTHFNLSSAISNFTSELVEKGEEATVSNNFKTAITIVIFFSFISIIVSILLTKGIPINLLTKVFFFSGLILYSFLILSDGLFKGYSNFFAAAIVESATGLFRLLSIVVIIIMESLGLGNILIFYSLAFIPPLVIASIYIYNKNPSVFKWDYNFDFNSLKKLLNYSKWICVTDLFSSGLFLISTFILARFSLKDLAIFNIVIFIYSLFQMFFGAITTVLIPQTAKYTARGVSIALPGNKEFCVLLSISLVVIFIILILPYKQNAVMYIFRNDVYLDVPNYITILFLSFPFKIISMINKGIIQGLKKTRPIAIVSIVVTFFAIILFIILYKKFQLYGAVFAITISSISEFYLNRYLVKKYLMEKYPVLF
jgi:O-antigen/teichoic acid export membrane protein